MALAPKAPEGPIDLPALLGAGPGATVELEIGFGRGRFLLGRAHAAKSAQMLGIEIKHKWAYLVSERAKREGLAARVRVFAGDAREILPRLHPEGCVARAFMHFPDPWWKKRHGKRRLRGPALLDPIAALLADGGELFVQTDVAERAEALLAELREHPAFEADYVAENDYGAQSNRELRAREDGLPVCRILGRRRARLELRERVGHAL